MKVYPLMDEKGYKEKVGSIEKKKMLDRIYRIIFLYYVIMPMHFTQVYNQERIYWFFSLNFLPPLIAISMKKSILIALSKPVVQRKPLDKEYLQGA